MNIIDPENNGGPSPNVTFDLEERYDKEIFPLIKALCTKANDMGLPVFVVVCYKADGKGGAWLASSARAREDFVPREWHVIRAVVEGEFKIIPIPPE